MAVQQLPFRLYGQITCPHCAAAQAFLTASGVAVQTVPIFNDPIAAAGLKQVLAGDVVFPVLVSLFNNEIVVGFKPDEYERLIKLFNAGNSPSAPDAVANESINTATTTSENKVEPVPTTH